MPEAIRSLSELARRFHRSRSVARRWTERADWPASPKPPWSESDVESIRSFVATLRPARQPGEHGPSTSAKLQLQEERAKLVRLQRQILARKYHDREACERRICGVISYTVAALRAMIESLPDELSNLNRQLWPDHLYKRLDATLERIRNLNRPEDGGEVVSLDEARDMMLASERDTK